MSFALYPLRPPGAVKEAAFRRLCIHCGKCLEVCPHDSLRLDGGFGFNRHTPYVDPKSAPCYLCMRCPPVCPTGALDALLADMKAVRMGMAYILKSGCHNYNNGIMCMTCYDRCPLRGQAIVLKDGLTPAITSKCAGCGVCAFVCPQKSIEIVPAALDYVPKDAAPTWNKA